MQVRNYQPGDERAQAEIYNGAAAGLPGFKPASAEEVARRFGADPEPSSKFYAVEGEQVLGYANFNPNGRISFPWCRPGCESAREPLLATLLATMGGRGHPRAWTTYRADWAPVLDFFEGRGFARTREMVNFVAERAGLPTATVPEGGAITGWSREDVPRLMELGEGLFSDDDPDALGTFYWKNPYFDPASLFALKRRGDGRTLGLGLAITNATYADPTKLDAAMPCFRLGALGTETERHKRVSGLVSVLFASEEVGVLLLAEAARRLESAGCRHAAAQSPSDRADLIAFYNKHFRRQGAFPILERRLGAGGAR